MENKKSGSVLVVGGGIGGIQASLDLAESGFKVYLAEKSPSIGGTMAQLDKTFPTNDCAMCIMSPKFVECARHRNIHLYPCSEVESISGAVGNFTVTLKHHATYVDPEKCTGCGECEKHCPVKRINGFDEGLSERKAIYRLFPQAAPNIFTIEKKGTPPCRHHCPAGCNAQGYIALISDGKFKEALDLIRETIPFPGVCGRVCGFCEEFCNRVVVDEAVRIRALKRFAADYELDLKARGETEEIKPPVQENKGTVAIVGAGPSGLTAAYDLAKMGYTPIVYEMMPEPGGMLRYGIPDYRLPGDILDYEINRICRYGVEIKTSTPVGRDLTINNLKEQGHKAIYIAIGTGTGRSLRIEGEDLDGVIQGVDFLHRINEGKIPGVQGKRVAVIGGGNTAIDAARSCLRLGAGKVSILYRRTRKEMPVSREECKAAEEEGISIHFLVSPVKITGTGGKVSEIICAAMRLGAPDESGRRRPVPIPGKSESFPVDMIIPALGQGVDDPLLRDAIQDLGRNRDLIAVDPVTLETNIPGVFAGGDVVGSGGYVVHAIAHGHEAAISIHRYMSGGDLKKGRIKKTDEIAENPPGYHQQIKPVPLQDIPVKNRITNFNEVEQSLTREEAIKEASRCLNCGICSECLQCAAACGAFAVDHSRADRIEELHVGSIILAPGCDKTDTEKLGYLGFGKYPDVVTSIQFERMLSASGPFGGHIRRQADGKVPEKIAFIQCVGSRDPVMGSDHCSAVCCMYAIKEAVIAKEHEAGVLPTIFYMDIRAYGKDFDRYYERAKNEYGVKFVKARVSGVRENENGKLALMYEKEDGCFTSELFDMVVLSIGFSGNGRLRGISHGIGVPLNQDGFLASDMFHSVHTKIPGIFQCGIAQEPKDIPDTVVQASAAAAAVEEALADSRFKEVREKEYPDEIEYEYGVKRIGVFICHCGINIGGTVNVGEIVEYVKTLPDIIYAEHNLYTCSQDTQGHMKDIIGEYKLNRIIVASCTPRTHEPLFQETIREAGLNRHLFAMANIRDQCSWVHMKLPMEATRKAKDLVRMAINKVRLAEPLPRMLLDVTRKALVVGGGPAGLSCALSLARQGFPVTLVEATEQLGGNMNRVHTILGGKKTKGILEQMKDEVQGSSLITVYLGSHISDVSGFIGNYKTVINKADNTKETIDHGVAVIATGGIESTPGEYLYGTDPRVKTGLEFETYLEQTHRDELPVKVVFIQCVGSREEDHMYCSKICCMETVKNGLALRKKRPDAEIYVLYRDIRTYGFSETYYRKAREAGIIFLRYEVDHKPEVSATPAALEVTVFDTQVRRSIVIPAHLLVLAARIDPPADNEILSQHFKVPLNKDNFYLEAHVKLRPVDFATEGVFLAGMSHSPGTLPGSIAQGRAAAARAATIISKSKFESEATIGRVDPEICAGCGLCAEVCEYNAIEMIVKRNGRRIATLNEIICKGCGSCAAACPSASMTQRGFTGEQILSEINAALEG